MLRLEKHRDRIYLKEVRQGYYYVLMRLATEAVYSNPGLRRMLIVENKSVESIGGVSAVSSCLNGHLGGYRQLPTPGRPAYSEPVGTGNIPCFVERTVTFSFLQFGRVSDRQSTSLRGQNCQ